MLKCPSVLLICGTGALAEIDIQTSVLKMYRAGGGQTIRVKRLRGAIVLEVCLADDDQWLNVLMRFDTASDLTLLPRPCAATNSVPPAWYSDAQYRVTVHPESATKYAERCVKVRVRIPGCTREIEDYFSFRAKPQTGSIDEFTAQIDSQVKSANSPSIGHKFGLLSLRTLTDIASLGEFSGSESVWSLIDLP